ncbi:hydroxymethylbilane synthase [Spirosoma utsteinense]|uniref:Porphobilinogen deaminase n=1 Tax=Spirosoma utsteinense TaxID=2585773 RepID=A0ABR6W189_9BACT|nr:hydroxymethylbilane synthase [Spirosoma utsteinense]MBC3785019.1 hydroxymethylbilane synthase [Spirosoma utsteinense]MBC3790372.1 hydroxymethylbilane synthase [Spirosoma utsteinense]
MHIKIGTRSSRLALWQAEHIQTCLEAGGLTSELVLIETKGDLVLDRSLAKIGSKGVFTQELEDQLRSGSIDIAVHSAKDLQSTLPPDLSIIAFTERERVNDVLVSRNTTLSLTSGQPFVVGTSSTRRVAMLRHFCPHIKVVDMRGNLQTRLRKLDDGQCDALLLAYAGVHRMHYDDLIAEYLPIEDFTPAVGQGSVAIEAADTLPIGKLNAIRQLTNHESTEGALKAERAFLRRLEGGCSIPVFALATNINDQISLTGGLIDLDGQQLLRETIVGPVAQAETIGHQLAERILGQGGDEILQAIRHQLSN